MHKLLKRLLGFFFRREKKFPYVCVYRVCGLSFTRDVRRKRASTVLQKNKVVFWTSMNHYACNPKYIAEALKESYSDSLDLVWITTGRKINTNEFPKEFRVVSGLREATDELSSAKVIVANERTLPFFKEGWEKKKDQLYIQTWHGSLGIKKTGVDREDLSEESHKKSEFEASFVDVILSNGTYTTDLYSRIFFQKGVIAEVGLPRDDIFFQKKSSNFRERYQITPDLKIVLYAPTWRDQGNTFETFDPSKVLDALRKRFGGRWLFMYRLHHLSKKYISLSGFDVSNYPDMQEILADVDVVITDYSSCIYDFVLTKKPGFIFAPDKSEYDSSRGLYYPLEQTPFPIAENADELLQNIVMFDSDKYAKDIKLFLERKGCREDGGASKKVANFIVNYINKGSKDFTLLDKAHSFD